MIKEPIGYGGTYYSQLNYPGGKGLMNQTFSFDRTLKRTGNSIDIKLIVAYVMDDFYDPTKSFEVLKSQSSYKVDTDGTLDTRDAYKIYEHAMICLIQGLSDIEKKTQNPVTTNLRPLPFEVILPDLEKFVDDFYKAA